MQCNVIKNLEITKGSIADYHQLSVYHYRDCTMCPFAAIFALRPAGILKSRLGERIAGVIVYTMPTAANQLRSYALAGYLSNLDRQTRLAVINRDIRTISRVIIEPRFRSLGLATRLVAETMERVDAPIIEAMAVMGHINPFFVKAGMNAYYAQPTREVVQLIEAFDYIGIWKDTLLYPEKVHSYIENTDSRKMAFIERQIQQFLQSYGKRRNMPPGEERIRFVLSKLTDRPVYYVKIKGEK